MTDPLVSWLQGKYCDDLSELPYLVMCDASIDAEPALVFGDYVTLC